MNSIGQALIAGLKHREAVTGAIATWAGQDYPCSGGSEFGGKSIQAGGLRATAQATIAIRQSLFAGGAMPAEKQLVTYKATRSSPGKTYRIDSINTALDAVIVLECNSPNQAA
jgi:hypothetical protein